MGFFDRNKAPECTEAYMMAERVLDQAEAFCNSVLEFVDGTTESEKKMISVTRDKLGNAAHLRESLQEGNLDPQACITMGFSLTFGELVQIVEKLDASTPEEEELIAAAKAQLETALRSGYGPAVEMQRKGEWPL